MLLAGQHPREETRLQGPVWVCLLHPLLLEADEALVHHAHRQVLVGQSGFHLIQDGGANWEQGRVVSMGLREAASALSSPLTVLKGRPAWRHPPRSAATGLPLVTTNSYLLRDWSPSQPAGWRPDRGAGWASTTTANSVATQSAGAGSAPVPRRDLLPAAAPPIKERKPTSLMLGH